MEFTHARKKKEEKKNENKNDKLTRHIVVFIKNGCSLIQVATMNNLYSRSNTDKSVEFLFSAKLQPDTWNDKVDEKRGPPREKTERK